MSKKINRNAKEYNLIAIRLNLQIFLSVCISSRYFWYMSNTGLLISKVFWPAFFYPKTLIAVFAALVVLTLFLSVRLIRTKKRISRMKNALNIRENALEAMPDGYYMWMYDDVGFLEKTFCSRRLAVMLGLTGGFESSFETLAERLTPQSAEELSNALRKMRNEGTPFSVEAENSSETAEFLISGFRQTTDNDRPLLDIIWVRDVTEHEKKYRKLNAECAEQKKRRAFFEAAIDALPFPVWMRNEDLQIVFCNPAYARAVNAASPEQAVLNAGEPVYEKSPREARILAAAARASGKEHKSEEFAVIDGKRKRIEVSEIPLPSENDAFRNRTIGFIRDITAEQELKEELQNHIASHNGVLEHLKTAIAVFNMDTRLQFYNTSFLRLWDLEEDWLDGSPTYSAFLDLLREKRRLPENRDFRAYKNQELRYFSTLVAAKEDIMHLPSGMTLRRMLTPHPLGGLLITYEDVTGHLSMERSMTVLSETQCMLINQMREGILVFGRDGRLKLANKAYMNLWHFSPQDYKKSAPSVTDIIESQKIFFENDADWASLKEQLLGVVSSHTGEFFQILRPDGKTIEFNAVALPDGGIFVSFFDVTEEERNSAILTEKDKLLSRYKQTALQADELRSSFVKALKTEISTPLNTLSETAAALSAEKIKGLSKEQKNALHALKNTASNLKTLLDDMTDLALLETGSSVLELDSLSVPELIKAAANSVREKAKLCGISLKTQCPNVIEPLIADKKRLKQVLYYLLNDALDAGYKGGTLLLKAKKTEENGEKKLCICVCASGLDLNDRPKEAELSFGFAAGLIRNLVEMHGGRLEISDENGVKESRIFLPLR